MSSPDRGPPEYTRNRSTSGKKSQLRSPKSGTSRNSISVVLPHATHDEIHRQSPVCVRALSEKRSPDLALGEKKNHSPHSGGTHPPRTTPQPQLSQNEIRRIVAARIIEQAWISFRDKQMFKLLKHAVCAAEHSLSYEILRKVAPKEAELLKDKCMPAKVRFRFGGGEYPPMIYFKIFTQSKTTGGMGVRYVSGKKMIKPASEAARDAYNRMGARLFYDQCMQDTLQQCQHRITSELDVTTLKDYMYYLSLLDELPANMGGRDNSWRKLTLEVLPRSTIFRDVVSYAYGQDRAMTPRLQEELSVLLQPPLSQDVQLQHIQIISAVRQPETTYTPNTKALSADKTSSRRSRQAKLRVLKMRKLYEDAQKGEEEKADPKIPAHHMFLNEEEEEWEDEADKLYQWTKELSMDDARLSVRALSPLPMS